MAINSSLVGLWLLLQRVDVEELVSRVSLKDKVELMLDLLVRGGLTFVTPIFKDDVIEFNDVTVGPAAAAADVSPGMEAGRSLCSMSSPLLSSGPPTTTTSVGDSAGLGRGL